MSKSDYTQILDEIQLQIANQILREATLKADLVQRQLDTYGDAIDKVVNQMVAEKLHQLGLKKLNLVTKDEIK